MENIGVSSELQGPNYNMQKDLKFPLTLPLSHQGRGGRGEGEFGYLNLEFKDTRTDFMQELALSIF